MNLESAACLKTLSGENVPLQGVSVRGRLQGLLLELTVEQRYRNDGARPIESVYTFPLSVSAVLLGFELDLNGRRYEAEAVARQAAEKRYEQAVDRGDSAALLTQNDEGLYTANLANLMPGETATIRYRYAEYLPVHCAVARLRIPTAITPRYGNPAAGGLQGPSVPRHDLVVDYPFDLEIELPQVGQANRLHSPSHSLDLAAGERGLIVRLNGKGALDRDFVLQVQGIEALNEVLVARDGLEQVAMVTATLPLRDRVPEPLALKLLVDCSGSMQGNSIVAAREALQAGLGQLDPEDRLSLSLFGSTLQHVTDGLESADDRTLAPLRALIGRVQADMGGTEMESAMKQVLAIPVPAERRADILLITDGAIHEVSGVLRQVAKSSHRLFVVMIGSAPNAALGKRIAEKTGGAYAFAASKHEAVAAIQQMFHRLREAPRRVARITWPTEPLWVAPLPTAVFSDEPLRLFAAFAAAPVGHVTVEIADGDTVTATLKLAVATAPAQGTLIPRMAAALRLTSLPDDLACQLAVRHRLASAHTSFVLVAERPEGGKATDLPVVVPVPQMVPDGQIFHDLSTLPMMSRRASSPLVSYSRSIGGRLMQRVGRPTRQVTPKAFLQALLDEYTLNGILAEGFDELFRLCGEPVGYRAILEHVLDLLPGATEEIAIRVFVAALTRDVHLTISDPLRERLDFGVSGMREFREARRYLESELRTA